MSVNAMTIERISYNLPKGFNPQVHLERLLIAVTDAHGPGWELDYIDPKANVARLVRQTAVTTVEDVDEKDRFEIQLAKGTKKTDGERIAARLESDNPGFTMTQFKPFLGAAEMTRLDTLTVRCRNAVATTIGVQPWDIQISKRRGGGWKVSLADKYVPSKHDDKLTEVAEQVVGQIGWTWNPNPAELKGELVPGTPPTFPPAIDYPMFDGFKPWSPIPVGWWLPKRAEDPVSVCELDLETSPHVQVSGTSGSGKSVFINSYIAGSLASGAELAIVDLPAKAQPLTARVPVPLSERFKDGWAMIGDLAVGDLVYAADGTATKVVGLSPVKDDSDVYEIEFSDGQVVKADGEHLWPAIDQAGIARLESSHGGSGERSDAEFAVWLRRQAREAAVSRQKATTAFIDELIETSPGFAARFAERMNVPYVEVPARGKPVRHYSVDEFLWAYASVLERGDGAETDPQPDYTLVTTVEMAERLHASESSLPNYAVPVARPIGGSDQTLPISPKRLGSWLAGGTEDGLTELLEREGLRHNKHIPDAYLRASYEQRMALLRAFSRVRRAAVGEGIYVFAAVPERLALSLLDLCRSLGLTPTFDIVERAAGIGFYDIKVDTAPSPSDKYRFVVDIRKVETEPVRCIRVAHPQHLFLTDGFIPTHNSVDFLWCKQFVRDGGWGCDKLADSVATLGLVYEEGQRRAKRLASAGVTSWKEMPKNEIPPPIVVVVDEVTGLFMLEKVAKHIDEDHPRYERLVAAPRDANGLRAELESYISKIAAELRFVGVKLLVASQVSSTTTGVPTALRMNLGNKLLLGRKPTNNNRSLALSDPTSVPKVPEYLAEDDKASRGVGVAELEGQEPGVFKSFYASTAAFEQWLLNKGVPTTDQPRPSVNDVARLAATTSDYDYG